MKLIVGLGNPGKDYENTRHNAGFMVLDAFAKELNLELHLEPKFKALMAMTNVDGEKVILLKPVTYMNLSGEAVRPVMNFYKIDVEDIIVVSDDLDSRCGRVRIRANGSAGGHNGHKSIMTNLGTEEYKRIKVGIDRSNVIPVVDWVLQKFSNDEMALINEAITKSCKALNDFVSGVPFVKIASLYSSK